MNLRHNTKRIFTAALALWLSGIVVLFCCENRAAMAEAESCPLAKKGNCSKTAEENSEHSFGQESRTLDCCAFPAKIFDKARKIEKSPESVAAATIVEIAPPKFSRVGKTFKRSVFRQSFVRNRGSRHLVNCVFRI